MAWRVSNLPARWDIWVQFLGWEDILEEEMATHSSILAWRIPWTEEPSGLQSMGSQSHMTEWLRHTQHLHYYSISYHVCYYYIWVYCLVGFPYFTDGFVLYYLTFLSLVEWRYLIFSSDYLAYLIISYLIINSVQFSHSVMSNSLRPHGLQRARLPCPAPPPRACSNSRWLSQWCHLPSPPLSSPSPPAFNLSQNQGLL